MNENTSEDDGLSTSSMDGNPRDINQEDTDENQEDLDENEPMCNANEPLNLTSQEKDWATMAECLRRPRAFISTVSFGGDLMKIPDNRIYTMDAVSKCWKTVARDSPVLLADETEGGSWAFCESCVAQLPKNIQSFIYFFHKLAAGIENLKHFAVPTRNVALRKKRGEKSKISDLIWHKPYESEARQDSGAAASELDLNEMMCERGRNNARSQNTAVRIAPFKMRLGFTGAVYRHGGEEHRKLIAVLVVTWARNWDMLGYIQDVFLRDPAKGINFKSRLQECKQMNLIWKSMGRFVAFKNLGLDETRVGMPEDYAEQPGGKLGCDSLFNLFQIPFQVYGIVKQDVLERARRSDPKLTLQASPPVIFTDTRCARLTWACVFYGTGRAARRPGHHRAAAPALQAG